jgi:signal transduction histidine kinase
MTAPVAGVERRPVPVGMLALVLLTAAVVAMSFAVRWLVAIPDRPPTPDSYLGNLVAAAACVFSGLTLRLSVTATWLAIGVAANLAAFNTLGIARAIEMTEPTPTWSWLVVAVELALVVAAGLAGTYAARPRSGSRRWIRLSVPASAAIAGVVIAIAAGLALVESLSATEPAVRSAAALRLSGRTAMGFAMIALLAGAGRDLAGPAGRARERLLDMPLQTRGATLAIYLRLLRDEMIPTVAEQRREAVEQERARLAADLHALVLPELRKAAEAAEANGGPGDPLATGLRSTLADIEQLMHARQSIVLEQFGLAAALEWLAERVEERSDVEVEIVEMGGPDAVEAADAPEARGGVAAGAPQGAAAMPIARQRAAFRVALLALDNVVRHAGARSATVTFGSDERRQWLAVVDDGRGMVVAARDPSRRGRGLTDMHAEATATGGRLDISTSSEGTRVEIAWFGPLRSNT